MTANRAPLPLALASFDRSPTLSAAERAALVAYPAVLSGAIFPRSGEAQQLDRALDRLTAPLTAVWQLRYFDPRQRRGARAVLYREMLRRGRSFWAWSPG